MKNYKLYLLGCFLIWRIWLFVIAAISPIFIPLFGNRFPYWQEKLVATGLPYWIWGFGNFDGVHYLTIAKDGYAAQYTQAFFPLFPWIVSLFTFSKYYFETALVLSNIFFLVSLFVVYKLFRLDFDQKISFLAIVLLLTFPTAFYFGAVYTESLFLLLTAASLYFARKQKFVLSGLFAALSSATRIFGVFLFFVLIVELWNKYKTERLRLTAYGYLKFFLGAIIAPLGLLGYMFYLKLSFNNPFFFISSQPFFGAERTPERIILLPQAVFRYLKILISVSPNNIAFYNALLELIFTLSAFALLIFTFRKIRTSYFVFTLSSFILPTLTGTLSSMPRYVLLDFLLLPFLVKMTGRFYLLTITAFSMFQAVLLMLFIRGYWVA